MKYGNRRTSKGRNRAMLALATAGVLSGLGIGAHATWQVVAGEPGTVDTSSSTLTAPRVDVDSLYRAIAAVDSDIDSVSVLDIAPDRVLSGRASWYGPGFHGRRTASGERFDRNAMTAAHKQLPFGTIVRVVDQASGRAVLVRITDRGPYSGGRILDLSEEAARRLGFRSRGTASVRAEVFARPGRSVDPLSFDAEGRGCRLDGYGVELIRTGDFDTALDLQQRLAAERKEPVYVTMLRDGSKTIYRVSLGLYATPHLCSSLMAEVEGITSSPRVIALGNEAATAVSDTTGSRASKTGNRGEASGL